MVPHGVPMKSNGSAVDKTGYTSHWLWKHILIHMVRTETDTQYGKGQGLQKLDS